MDNTISPAAAAAIAPTRAQGGADPSPLTPEDVFAGPVYDAKDAGLYQASVKAGGPYTEEELLCCAAIACCAGAVIFAK